MDLLGPVAQGMGPLWTGLVPLHPVVAHLNVRTFGWRSCSGIKFDFLSCFYDVVVHIIFLGNIIAFGGL